MGPLRYARLLRPLAGGDAGTHRGRPRGPRPARGHGGRDGLAVGDGSPRVPTGGRLLGGSAVVRGCRACPLRASGDRHGGAGEHPAPCRDDGFHGLDGSGDERLRDGREQGRRGRGYAGNGHVRDRCHQRHDALAARRPVDGRAVRLVLLGFELRWLAQALDEQRRTGSAPAGHSLAKGGRARRSRARPRRSGRARPCSTPDRTLP